MVSSKEEYKKKHTHSSSTKGTCIADVMACRSKPSVL